MNIVPFIAESASDAVKQIRARLGPEAVVLNVRKLPVNGLSRLWNKSQIEVLACVPDANAAPASHSAQSQPAASLLDVREADDMVSLPPAPAEATNPESPSRRIGSYFTMPGAVGAWQSPSLLQTMGISSLNAERVMERLRQQYGEVAPQSLRSELAVLRSTLAGFWKSNRAPSRLHVFIGTPGSGKTTTICKWLTQAALLDGASARVWRLDVPRANLAEALSVHAEILNVPIERAWNPGATWLEENLFIDLPGVETGDTVALAKLERLLSTMPGASVSLVMNAAYDTTLLQTQVRAFARLPITDLLFTHLDEEPRWSKLWNFVLGTNYSLSFLGAGQNIPGQFLRATPEALFPAEIRASDESSARAAAGKPPAKHSRTESE